MLQISTCPLFHSDGSLACDPTERAELYCRVCVKNYTVDNGILTSLEPWTAANNLPGTEVVPISRQRWLSIKRLCHKTKGGPDISLRRFSLTVMMNCAVLHRSSSHYVKAQFNTTGLAFCIYYTVVHKRQSSGRK
jgi:uncharacterized protein YbaR (Trm112 family)